MGMDVCGRHPSSEAGEYFGASAWSWRPIHALIIELCSDLLDEDTLRDLAYNDGAGPTTQEVCTQMANRFDRWMEHNVHGLQLDLGLYVDSEGRPGDEDQPSDELLPAHRVDDEHLKEWVEFLRHCGGFEVW